MKVAVAIIYNEKQEILITRRPLHTNQGGKWEFPGGKLEAQEDAKTALNREIKEEINLEVHQSIYLGEVNYEYEDRQVHLLIYKVEKFSGEPICLEKQLDMRWVAVNELDNFDFPKANKEIINLIRKEEIIMKAS